MKTIYLRQEKHSRVILETIKVLKDGGLAIVPSDTVYGLIADATNEKAVKKLIAFKSRLAGKAISVFVSDFEMMEKCVTVGTIHELSLHEILPGPFTVILKSRHQVSPLLESEKGTLGVRIPDYSFINNLLKKFGKPTTATSANISGRPAHYSIETLFKELSQKKKDLIDLVVDAGKLPRNKPSTIIDLTTPELKILRQGDIIFDKNEKFLSESPSQTKKIARYILKKLLARRIDKPLIFIIEGDLGVGKTVFVKGIGEELGVNNIISPTFVVSYEYNINSKFRIQNSKLSTLVHYDLYNINEKEEFKYLGIEKYLNKNNILCFEWGEKAGDILELLRAGKIVRVKMEYKGKKTREIVINF